MPRTICTSNIVSSAHSKHQHLYEKCTRLQAKDELHALYKLKNFNWYITYLNILLFTCTLARMICRFVQVFGPCMHAMPILFLPLLLLFLRIHIDFSIYQGAHILFDYGNWVVIYIHQVYLYVKYVHTIIGVQCMQCIFVDYTANVFIAFKAYRTDIATAI